MTRACINGIVSCVRFDLPMPFKAANMSKVLALFDFVLLLSLVDENYSMPRALSLVAEPFKIGFATTRFVCVHFSLKDLSCLEVVDYHCFGI